MKKIIVGLILVVALAAVFIETRAPEAVTRSAGNVGAAAVEAHLTPETRRQGESVVQADVQQGLEAAPPTAQWPVQFDESQFAAWKLEEIENRLALLSREIEQGRWVERSNRGALDENQRAHLARLLQEVSVLRNVAAVRHMDEAEALLEEL